MFSIAGTITFVEARKRLLQSKLISLIRKIFKKCCAVLRSTFDWYDNLISRLCFGSYREGTTIFFNPVVDINEVYTDSVFRYDDVVFVTFASFPFC